RRVIGGGISLDDASWDKLHYLTGREPAQIEAFTRALRDLLVGARLADIDDEHLILEMRDAGQSPGPLKRFVEHALRLAEALPGARAAVPPPASMAAAVPSWRELARALGGELDVASMAVSGRYQEVPCAVATSWLPNGETQHTELSLDAALSERHQLIWSEGKLVAGNTAELPTPARELWETLIADCISLTLDRARIVLWDRAPLLEAQTALPRLGQLAALSALLRGAHGPYR
ncbi:MAG TPA: hypothetical protein VFB62_11195, partial [Polyangiaceae bacterium]|nr:hypothetical protein [Polyangiaceae bacterium]